jgi:hypothetical protein
MHFRLDHACPVGPTAMVERSAIWAASWRGSSFRCMRVGLRLAKRLAAPHPALPGLWDARPRRRRRRARPAVRGVRSADRLGRRARRRLRALRTPATRPRDNGLRATDPAHCARCNP